MKTLNSVGDLRHIYLIVYLYVQTAINPLVFANAL